MTYRDPNDLKAGNTKLSEIAVDTASPLLASPVHDSMIRVSEQSIKILADLLRRQNFFFRSAGNIYWDGTKIILDDGGSAQDMILDILQTDNVAQPKISLTIAGNITANNTTSFKNIPLADNELLYLELDPTVILAGGTSITIENGIDYTVPTVTAGKLLKKVNLSVGMPTLVSPVDGSTSTTYYIPIAYRIGSNIHWIPHGIVWPQLTNSPLGAIITSGITPYPEKFVNSEAGLILAMSDLLALGGGVCLLTGSFAINSLIVVPANVKIIGRGHKIVVTLNPGGEFQMLANSEMQDFAITSAAAWTAVIAAAVYMSANRCRIRNIKFNLSASADSGTTKAVHIGASHCRIYESWFVGVAAATFKIGIYYTSGYSNNADVDCLFE